MQTYQRLHIVQWATKQLASDRYYMKFTLTADSLITCFFILFVSDAPIPVFINRSDTDTFKQKIADTGPILMPKLGA